MEKNCSKNCPSSQLGSSLVFCPIKGSVEVIQSFDEESLARPEITKRGNQAQGVMWPGRHIKQVGKGLPEVIELDFEPTEPLALVSLLQIDRGSIG